MKKCDELRIGESCLNRAAADEIIFVLRAHDPTAAQTVRLWAAMNNDWRTPEKINDALDCAAAMDAWRAQHTPAAVEVKAERRARVEDDRRSDYGGVPNYSGGPAR